MDGGCTESVVKISDEARWRIENSRTEQGTWIRDRAGDSGRVAVDRCRACEAQRGRQAEHGLTAGLGKLMMRQTIMALLFCRPMALRLPATAGQAGGTCLVNGAAGIAGWTFCCGHGQTSQAEDQRSAEQRPGKLYQECAESMFHGA